MNRQEFDALTESSKGKCSGEEFIAINTVYTFHPSIRDIGGKGQIAKLYLEYGMAVIQDMLPRAEKLMMLDQELFKAQAEVDRVKKQIAKLSQ